MLTYNRMDMAINSIANFLNQTYENKELIIINTGTEWYQRTLGSFIDSQNNESLKHIIHYRSPYESLGSLRNLGMFHATGNYIATWDDDDVNSRTRLESQMYWLEKENADMVFFKNFKMRIEYSKQTFKVEYKNGLEPTMLMKRIENVFYPLINKHEDSFFIKDLVDSYNYIKFVIDNDSNDYIYNCHSDNVSGRNHFDTILKINKSSLIQ